MRLLHKGAPLKPHPAVETADRPCPSLILLCAAALLTAAAATSTLAQTPPLPKSPVTINVVDVAGDLALTQAAIEAYQAKNPNLVSKVSFTKAPAPELPAKLKAMQAAGRSDI